VGATVTTASSRGLFSKAGVNTHERELTFLGLLFAGAVARSAAATAVHPLNVIKIMLQRKGGVMPEFAWNALMRGSGSQLIWSIPHGAFSFCVIEKTKKVLALWSAMFHLDRLVPQHLLNPLMDFLSSCVSTFICSVISTPQMVTTDRIMANVYPNLYSAVTNIFATDGLSGFYVGWLPAMVQKIPSYALTWMLFQQLKTVFCTMYGRVGTAMENTMLGSAAAAGACSIMIPVDTIKTRIVTQHPDDEHVYTGGVVDTFFKILDAEGMRAFYRALPPRLLAVVPMIGIQFSTYELMKKLLLSYPLPK
jgi:solute carrier family 25 S-adenosylmethionine transporter 26